MTPPLPELMEELVEEVLLRFPPDDPASLVRAALVCKLWCHLVSGTVFRRRFREFHSHHSGSAAPLLSVIYTGNCKLGHDTDDPSLKHIRAMPSPMAAYHGIVSAPDGHKWVAIDARHGRVLLYTLYPWHTICYSMWNPITNEQWHLPKLPYNMCYDYSSTVVCAATASGNCDHLDCHRRRPFQVVVMEILNLVMKLVRGASSLILSSISLEPRRVGWFAFDPVVPAGSALYLLVRLCDEVVKYDLATREVSAIPLPSEIRRVKLGIKLIADDDGEIGFVSDKEYYRRISNWDPDKFAVSTSSGSPSGSPADVPMPRPMRRCKPNPKYAGPTWMV